MIHQMYSIYDKKACMFMPPETCHNDGDALRYFEMKFMKVGGILTEYPEDFDIYHLGEFDDSTGVAVAHKTPKQLANGQVFFNADKGLKEDPDGNDYR